MARVLKVFGTSTMVAGDPSEYAITHEHDRFRTVIVAAATKREALEILRMSRGDFQFRGHEVVNEYQCAIAMARPGVMLVKAGRDYGPAEYSDWHEGLHKGAGSLIMFGDLLVPMRHVLDGPHKTNNGFTPIAPRRVVYGTAGRCSCGLKFRSNEAPTKGGRAAVKAEFRRHVQEIIEAARAATEEK